MGGTSKLRRNKRTPYTEAMSVLHELLKFYSTPPKKSLNAYAVEAAFIKEFIKPMLHGQPSSVELKEKLFHLVETTDVEKIPTLFVAWMVSCTYAFEAVREYRAGSDACAWAFVVDAKFWLGVVLGADSENKINDDVKRLFSAMGKKGASARYAPNAALKEWVISRYQEGSYPSANKAASALKEAAIAHGRTIGAVISEENAQRTFAEWIRKYKAASR